MVSVRGGYISKYNKNEKVEDATSKRLALLEWIRRQDEERMLRHNSDSVSLIKTSNARGMSRKAMVRIWGERLVTAVLGHDGGK